MPSTQAVGLAGRLRAVRLRLVAELAAALRRFFRAQARRVTDRYVRAVGLKVAAEDLLPAEEDRELLRTLLPLLRAVIDETDGLAAAMVGATDALADTGLSAQLAESATRVIHINQRTRAAIRETLRSGQERGYTDRQIAYGVPKDEWRGLRDVVEETYRGRAEAIARTEIGWSSQQAAHGRYADAGIDQVEILDGPGCGWTTHDDPDTANGKILSVAEARAYPLAHPNCLAGDMLVLAPYLDAAFARWFEGEVVTLRTAMNDHLTATPNHPVLTDHGWVPVGKLREGDYVVRCRGAQRVFRLVDPDHDQVPTPIEQVARALREASPVAPRRVPAAAEDFHGDGMGGEIYVIGADRLREYRGEPAFPHERAHPLFRFSDVRLGALFAQRAACQVFGGSAPAAYHVVGGCYPTSASLWRDSRRPALLSLADRIHRVAPLSERLADGPRRPSEFLGEHMASDFEVPCIDGIEVPIQAAPPGWVDGKAGRPKFAGERAHAYSVDMGDFLEGASGSVALVQIMQVQRRPFAGHVYNLETGVGWYVANHLIVHNCRRISVPYRPSWPRAPAVVPFQPIAEAR